jgi:hypothetical protein
MLIFHISLTTVLLFYSLCPILIFPINQFKLIILYLKFLLTMALIKHCFLTLYDAENEPEIKCKMYRGKLRGNAIYHWSVAKVSLMVNKKKSLMSIVYESLTIGRYHSYVLHLQV